MTARYHLASADVAAAVKATEPCPHHLHRGGGVGGMTFTACPGCGAVGATTAGPRKHLPVPSLVGGWLTLPWPVQPGHEVRMVEEEWTDSGEPYGLVCEGQAWFATVIAGEVVEEARYRLAPGSWSEWNPAPIVDGFIGMVATPDKWEVERRYAVQVASVVLHDPPVVTMPGCPYCDGPEADYHTACIDGSVPLSVEDGQEVAT